MKEKAVLPTVHNYGKLTIPEWISQLGHEIAGQYGLEYAEGILIAGMIYKAMLINMELMPLEAYEECCNNLLI
jgi:hypothetical protein